VSWASLRLFQCRCRYGYCRLIETHIGFVKNVTEKMDELLRDIGKLIDKAEITIAELEKTRKDV
jgi:hypothetical protein